MQNEISKSTSSHRSPISSPRRNHFRKGFTLRPDYGEVLIGLPVERSHFVMVLAREDEDEQSPDRSFRICRVVWASPTLGLRLYTEAGAEFWLPAS